ncbi:MAG TPA: ergothioneine biosynthesis protein EgtB [Acidimicrobiales bacterium]|nr:ergothioneine biosynthesis protein EgtB [Acidimicrobiales bacterium]
MSATQILEFLKPSVAALLESARARSLLILEPLREEDVRRQHSPLMAPLVWDLAHVGNYEDLWLLRAVGKDGVRPSVDDLYDAFRHPRVTRPALPLLGPREARAYIAEVRRRALDSLDLVEFDPSRPLLRDGFVYGLVVQHEHQHDETMLATRQLMGECSPPLEGMTPAPPAEARDGATAGAEVLVPGGRYVIGTDFEPWAYDNERPAHEVSLARFWIDTVPVTCGAYREFIEAGGYGQRRWWTDDGWSWRQEAELAHPQFWQPEGAGSWSVLRFGARRDLRLDEPVQHVCWHEADAYARWRGRRLPSEAEWEVAASIGPDGGKRRFPWGDARPIEATANVGQRHDGPAPVGAYPAGASAFGCLQMVGDVWEWTSSDFGPYPGFESFPYREYSEVFFDSGYKVLRGGCWATWPGSARCTFRNWDHPIRRHIFSGFRCARDA